MSSHYTYTEELSVNESYTENPPLKAGFTTYVNGEVDTSVPGTYEVTYTFLKLEPFETITEVKLVTVTADPQTNATITLNGAPVVSLVLDDANTYIDDGATSTDGTVFVTNLDGTSSESFTGLPSVAGSYTLIYYVAGAFSNFVTRTIHVSDPNSGGGGGGGGVSAPASGPRGVDVSITIPTTGPKNTTFTILPSNGPTGAGVSIPVPTTGPKSVGLEVFTALPTRGPKTVVTKSIPAQSFPIVGTSTDTPDSNAPAQSFPIVGTTTDSPDSNAPAQSFPIVGTQA